MLNYSGLSAGKKKMIVSCDRATPQENISETTARLKLHNDREKSLIISREFYRFRTFMTNFLPTEMVNTYKEEI